MINNFITRTIEQMHLFVNEIIILQTTGLNKTISILDKPTHNMGWSLENSFQYL